MKQIRGRIGVGHLLELRNLYHLKYYKINQSLKVVIYGRLVVYSISSYLESTHSEE